MNPQREPGRSAGTSRRGVVGLAILLAATAAGGCKSDLNQQLLERELRYQEDQIYQLQDELAANCARLEQVSRENGSLRQQLGVSAGDAVAPGQRGRARTPAAPPAALVPPSVEVPDATPLPAPRGPAPPATLEPPALEGVPPLPGESVRPPAADADSLSLPPAAAAIDPAARPIAAAEDPGDPVAVRMSYDDPAHEGRAVRLVINQAATAGIDADGDGRPDGLAVVIEPRDAEDRLAPVAGDVTVTAFDAAAAPGGQPLARWTVPAAEAQARFRPTGRRRGVTLELPWQAGPPRGDHVRLQVQLATDGGLEEAEALVSAGP